MDPTQQQMQRKPTHEVGVPEPDFFHLLKEFAAWAAEHAPGISPMIERQMAAVQDNIYGDVQEICDYILEGEPDIDSFNEWMLEGKSPFDHIIGRAARASGRDWKEFVDEENLCRQCGGFNPGEGLMCSPECEQAHYDACDHPGEPT
jgi:hypothetical protein